MRAVIQRVSEASVAIHGQEKASIGLGLLVLLGISEDDEQKDAEWLSGKIWSLRIFSDRDGKMNLSAADVAGEFLVISQFTLYASTRKGNRPGFIKAARPEKAIPLYHYFVTQIERMAGVPVKTGEFGADMQIALVNDGPVTIVIDSQLLE